MTGRTMRAQANFQETFPIAIVALLGVVIAGRTSQCDRARRLDLARRAGRLSAALRRGVPVIRTVVWTISIVGLGMVIWPLLSAEPPGGSQSGRPLGSHDAAHRDCRRALTDERG